MTRERCGGSGIPLLQRRHITMRSPLPLASLAPEYTAPRARMVSREVDEVRRAWLADDRAGAVSATSERYPPFL